MTTVHREVRPPNRPPAEISERWNLELRVAFKRWHASAAYCRLAALERAGVRGAALARASREAQEAGERLVVARMRALASWLTGLLNAGD